MWVKKNCGAATMLLVVGAVVPASLSSTWERRTSWAVAVSGGRAQEGGKAPDIADVVALVLSCEPAHIHVFDQPPTQRAHRGGRQARGILSLLS